MALSALVSSTAPAGEIANRAVTCTGGRLPSLGASALCSGTKRVAPKVITTAPPSKDVVITLFAYNSATDRIIDDFKFLRLGHYPTSFQQT